MSTSTVFAPPNSVVLICDPINHVIPDSMDEQPIVATNSCIAVGCRSEIDGATKFVLGDLRKVDPGRKPAFVGEIDTPSHRVTVHSVLGQIILEAHASKEKTKIHVWTNDVHEPDEVIIGCA